MKNVINPWFVAACCVLVLAVIMSRAAQYEFKGVYTSQDVFLNYCDSCYLQLPPEFLLQQLVLSISVNSEREFINALKVASKANGWELQYRKGMFTAEPLQGVGMRYYISCLDRQVKEVPKHMYGYYLKSDSLNCAYQDSLNAVQRAANDSTRRYNDSLGSLPPLGFSAYELRYYAYSKAFQDKIGVQFQEQLLSGTLHDKIKVYDSWAAFATETNDTSFSFRKINIVLDSAINLDWGQEEQVISNTFNDGGIVNNNYEWRKYGMIIQIAKKSDKIKLDYTFREKDNSISVLQGSAVGTPVDTLTLTGEYTSNREISTGVPFVSRIPLIGYLFSVKRELNDLKKFELYLIPKQNNKQEQEK